MRIAIITDFFYPELSGISGTVKKMAKSLGERNEVLVIAPGYSKKEFLRIEKDRTEIDLGPRVKIVRLPSFSISGTYTRIFPIFGKTYREISKFKPDIIHTHTPFSIDVLLKSKISKIPLVGTNHTPVGDYIGNAFLKKFVRKYYAWFYNKLDFTSVPSKFLALYMRDDGFNGKYEVISNPIVLEKFSKDFKKDEIKKEFGISGSSIIYSGRLSPEKKVHVLIRAIPIMKESIPNINLIIAGYGPEEEELKKSAVDLGVHENIKFLGFVRDEDYYPKLFKACEIFVSASTAETEGMSMMAGMASGLPVIVANAKAAPEYVDGNGYLFEPGNVDELAEKIIALLKNHELREIFSQKSLELVKHIDIKKIAGKWEKIYLDLIEKAA